MVIRVGEGSVTVERTTGRVEWFATADFTGERPTFEPVVVGGELIVDDGCSGAGGLFGPLHNPGTGEHRRDSDERIG